MKFNNTNKAIELETRANEARRTRGDGEGEGRLAQAYNKSINEESMGKDGARRRRGSSVLTVRLVGSKGHRAQGTGLRILGSLYLLFTVPAGRACKGCATLRMNHDEREREGAGEGTQRISRTCSWSRERERGEGDRKWHAFKEFQLARAPRLTPLLLRSPFGQPSHGGIWHGSHILTCSDPHILWHPHTTHC